VVVGSKMISGEAAMDGGIWVSHNDTSLCYSIYPSLASSPPNLLTRSMGLHRAGCSFHRINKGRAKASIIRNTDQGNLVYRALDRESTKGDRNRMKMSYPIFMPKSNTHRMHDSASIVPHIQSKVFTDNQMSWIKYDYYYINSVSKDYDDSQWNEIAEDSITPQERQPGQRVA
jgi:hypothetical protein